MEENIGRSHDDRERSHDPPSERPGRLAGTMNRLDADPNYDLGEQRSRLKSSGGGK
tara:strand:- start:2006 stop:2173 length:168 start_codon:yes stop_codon:yes gene_type:complete